MDCPCTKDCELHGNCRACKLRHHSRGELTACEKLRE